jgi:hypothetical protein
MQAGGKLQKQRNTMMQADGFRTSRANASATRQHVQRQYVAAATEEQQHATPHVRVNSMMRQQNHETRHTAVNAQMPTSS